MSEAVKIELEGVAIFEFTGPDQKVYPVTVDVGEIAFILDAIHEECGQDTRTIIARYKEMISNLNGPPVSAIMAERFAREILRLMEEYKKKLPPVAAPEVQGSIESAS